MMKNRGGAVEPATVGSGNSVAVQNNFTVKGVVDRRTQQQIIREVGCQFVKQTCGSDEGCVSVGCAMRPPDSSLTLEHQALHAVVRAFPDLIWLKDAHHYAGRGADKGPEGAPDFVHVAHELGVEISEVIRGDGGERKKATAEMRWRIMNEAWKQSSARDFPPIRVGVSFRNVPISKLRAPALAGELVDLVALNLPSLSGSVELAGTQVPREVRTVSADRHESREQINWIPEQSWWVNMDAAPIIQDAINRKAQKHARYREHCGRCWLVLWVYSGQEDGGVDLSAAALAYQYSSPFERTYLWDRWRDKVHLLQV